VRRAFGSRGRPCRARVILEAAAPPGDPGEPPAGAGLSDPVFLEGSYTEGVLHLADRLAAALAFLHDQGICHRDLKPSNVLVSPQGQPLLLDFNLSSDGLLAGERLGGTLPYMAPGQVRTPARRGADGPARPVAGPRGP